MASIAILYSEVMGYTMATLKALVTRHKVSVHVFFWDKNKLSEFAVESQHNITYYPRSKHSDKDIVLILSRIKPALVFVSGWMDKGYIIAAKRLKNKMPRSSYVIGFDNQFSYSLRSLINIAQFRFSYKRLFTHAWVPGPDQYTLARLFGFDRHRIRLGLYSADTKSFNMNVDRQRSRQRRFIYLGRYAKVKNVQTIIEAYKLYLKLQTTDRWKLQLYGSGPDIPVVDELIRSQVEVHGFAATKTIAQEFAQGGVLVLASLSEAWGVVIHEASTAGLPMIISREAGSASNFLIDGYNGFFFDPKDATELATKMLAISRLSDNELDSMSQNSLNLSTRYTSNISAAYLKSMIPIYYDHN